MEGWKLALAMQGSKLSLVMLERLHMFIALCLILLSHCCEQYETMAPRIFLVMCSRNIFVDSIIILMFYTFRH
jgi:hypothetical protein